MLDAHVHTGWFKDRLGCERFFSPKRVFAFLKLAGLHCCIFSSTTMQGGYGWDIVWKECEEMVEVSQGHAYPLLWITRPMLKASPDLSKYKNLRYYGLKIHGCNDKWDPFGKALCRIFDIARERNLPVTIHTGGNEACNAKKFLSICLKYPDVKVILAHGRPGEQALEVLKATDNVYVDTAFSPLADIRLWLQKGFANRVIFGTDTPIPLCFFNSSLNRYVQRRIANIQQISGKSWPLIAEKNAISAYGLQNSHSKGAIPTFVRRKFSNT